MHPPPCILPRVMPKSDTPHRASTHDSPSPKRSATAHATAPPSIPTQGQLPTPRDVGTQDKLAHAIRPRAALCAAKPPPMHPPKRAPLVLFVPWTYRGPVLHQPRPPPPFPLRALSPSTVYCMEHAGAARCNLGRAHTDGTTSPWPGPLLAVLCSKPRGSP